MAKNRKNKKVLNDYLKSKGWGLKDVLGIQDRMSEVIGGGMHELHEQLMRPIHDEMKRLDDAWRKYCT